MNAIKFLVDYGEVTTKIISLDRTQVEALSSSLKAGKDSTPFPTDALLNAAEHFINNCSNEEAKKEMTGFVERTNSALEKADEQFLQKLEREIW